MPGRYWLEEEEKDYYVRSTIPGIPACTGRLGLSRRSDRSPHSCRGCWGGRGSALWRDREVSGGAERSEVQPPIRVRHLVWPAGLSACFGRLFLHLRDFKKLKARLACRLSILLVLLTGSFLVKCMGYFQENLCFYYLFFIYLFIFFFGGGGGGRWGREESKVSQSSVGGRESTRTRFLKARLG